MAATRPASLDELTTRFHGPLTRFFTRRLPNDHDAQDMVHEVLLRLVRHQHELDKIAKIDGYIFTIARNVLRDHARRPVDAFVDIPTGVEEIAEDQAFAPDRILIGRETVSRMVEALEELPKRTRTIFVLYHFESVPQVEIARRLFISLSAVEKHMARANAKILRRIGPL